MSNPIIDLSNAYNWWYNVQPVQVLNPDGVAWTMTKSIQRVVDTGMENIGPDTYGQRTRCNFLFFTSLIPEGKFPQVNTRITDANNNTYWYVYDIENMYFGNVIKLYTESRAGIGVEDEQYPNITKTTTSTTSTTAAPVSCESNTDANGNITLIDQSNVCAKHGIAYAWDIDNKALDIHENAYVSLEMDATGVVDFVADAGGLLNGSAIVTINGVPVGGGNYAGTTLSFSTGVTAGDIVNFHWYTEDAIVYGAVNVLLTLIIPTTTTTTTAGP